MAESDRLNIALVGAGGRGLGVRLPHILLMKDRFNLVAICDVDGEKARKVAAEHGVRAYTRLQDLVKHERLDVAAISTPGDSHHAIGAYLAGQKVNLIVETPVAITLPTTDLLIDAVERNGVKLEVAEQYPRDPMHFMKRKVIDLGLIGPVLRVYSLFQTGGYHIVSSLRMMAGAEATRVTGLVMDTPIPRVNASAVRQFTSEEWSMGMIDFANGALAITAYSPLYHARALGRKTKTLFQVDGATGAIVEDDVHLTTEEQRLNGGRASVFPIRTVTRKVEDVDVLERLEIETDPKVAWENPWPHYKIRPAGLAIVEEMDSLAQAILNDRPTRYDARRGRADQEIVIAWEESGRQGRVPVDLPLKRVTGYEEELHARFRERHGCDPMDVERLVDVFFPKV